MTLWTPSLIWSSCLSFSEKSNRTEVQGSQDATEQGQQQPQELCLWVTFFLCEDGWTNGRGKQEWTEWSLTSFCEMPLLLQLFLSSTLKDFSRRKTRPDLLTYYPTPETYLNYVSSLPCKRLNLEDFFLKTLLQRHLEGCLLFSPPLTLATNTRFVFGKRDLGLWVFLFNVSDHLLPVDQNIWAACLSFIRDMQCHRACIPSCLNVPSSIVLSQ